MKNTTKYSALVTTILLTSALAGPANADTPSTAQLGTVPTTETSQITAVKAEPTSLKFDRTEITTSPAPVAVAAVYAPVTPQSSKVEVKPTTPVQGAPVAGQASPAPVVAPSSGRGATIAAAAYAQIGIAQDCTALATNSLAAAGINFHGWPAEYMALGSITSTPVAGDLIYYANGGAGVAHIAVYVGNGMAIHGGFNGSTKLFSVNVGSGPIFIHIA